MRKLVAPGQRIFYLGQPYKIVHVGGRGLTRLVEDELHVTGGLEHLPRRIRDFYRAEAARFMLPIIYKYSQYLGVKFNKIRFKDTRTRWGSASNLRNLSFCWRIMMAPEQVVHYLVAHEVAHLCHMNHSRAFWATCALLCPQWRYYKEWLKQNGSAIMSVGFDASESCML